MTLGVTPDEKKDNDEIINLDGLVFVIEKGLMESIKRPVTIDYKNKGLFKGFKVFM